MIAEIFGWFVFIFFTSTFFLSIFYPLFLWYIKKDRTSKIYRAARLVRIVFGVVILLTIALFILKPTSLGGAELFGAIGGKLLFSYLLMRKWAPKSSS